MLKAENKELKSKIEEAEKLKVALKDDFVKYYLMNK